jgi:hypothetical protein
MTTQQNPYLVSVRLSTGFAILEIVLGAVLGLVGLLVILAGGFSVWIVLGPLFLIMGILSLSKPYCTYDTATGALYLHSPLGIKYTYGAPKGERVYFDRATSKVMRARQNGAPRKVSMFSVNREELARLISVLPQA